MGRLRSISWRLNKSRGMRLLRGSDKASSTCRLSSGPDSPLTCMTSRFIPLYFEKDISSGTPTLTREGLKAVEDELGESSPHCLEGYDEPAGKSTGVGS